MIIDLKHLSENDREDLLREAGDMLKHIPFPIVHPDRPSSRFFYEIIIKEDAIQTARRLRVEGQRLAA
jgi:hypothetical protein